MGLFSKKKKEISFDEAIQVIKSHIEKEDFKDSVILCIAEEGNNGIMMKTGFANGTARSIPSMLVAMSEVDAEFEKAVRTSGFVMSSRLKAEKNNKFGKDGSTRVMPDGKDSAIVGALSIDLRTIKDMDPKEFDDLLGKMLGGHNLGPK